MPALAEFGTRARHTLYLLDSLYREERGLHGNLPTKKGEIGKMRSACAIVCAIIYFALLAQPATIDR